MYFGIDELDIKDKLEKSARAVCYTINLSYLVLGTIARVFFIRASRKNTASKLPAYLSFQAFFPADETWRDFTAVSSRFSSVNIYDNVLDFQSTQPADASFSCTPGVLLVVVSLCRLMPANYIENDPSQKAASAHASEK